MLLRTAPRRLALACALALSAQLAMAPVIFAADAVAPPKGMAPGPCVEGICEYTLGNGLRVLLFPDASKPTVTVNIAYGVGSVHENYGETGMAHLLEHMLFKGTPKHGDIPGGMKARGIATNATTSLDRTNYYGSFPANEETLDWLLGLEADRMLNSFVAKKDLDSEMTVVRNEMERGESSPGSLTFQRLRSTAYLWHNYGKSTIGARSDVENVPIERLQAFYRTWYRPDNATLIVAGRIEPATALAKVQQHFGTLARPKAPLPKLYTTEPTQDGEREVNVRRSGDVRFIGIGYHTPGATHPDSAALTVLMNAIGNVPTGRLHKALVETKLAASASGGNNGLREGGMAMLLLAAPKDADIVKAEAELIRQAESGLVAMPVTADEVAQAKARIANAYERNFTDVNGVAMSLTESVAAGDWRLYFLQRDRIAQVTVDDVNRVARTYFKSSNRTIARFIPTDGAERVEIAAAPSAEAALKGYTAKAALAAGEVFEPTPANIEARTERFTIGKLRVALLPKDTRGDTVSFKASLRFGDIDSLKGTPTAAPAAAGAMLMRGTGSMSREQIAQRFDALKTQASIEGRRMSVSIDLNSRRENLADALVLATDIVRNPAFPESEFEQYRMQSITGLESARKEPNSVTGQAMSEYFDPWPEGHPLAYRSIEESLADLRALKREDLIAFHRARYGASEGEITVVGDFDPAAVKAQLQTLFGDWASPVPYVEIANRHHAMPARKVRLETPDKANASVKARLNLSLNDNDPEFPALQIANSVLGSSALDSRLGQRLRQKDGLTYSVFSVIDADASRVGRNDDGEFLILAIAAPQNVDRLEAAMREEVQRFVRDGITAAELKSAVNDLLTSRQRVRADDANLTGALAGHLYYGRTMAWTAAFEAKLAALTVEDVNAAIRKHIKPEAISVFAAGDFAKATKAAPAAAK